MNSPVVNKLLASLSAESRNRLLKRGLAISLPLRFTFYDAGEVPSFAYFITSGIASVMMTTTEGGIAEVTVVGCEGFIGGQQLFGSAKDSLSSFMQIAGTGIRVPIEDLREEFELHQEVFRRILEFTQVQMLTISNLAGCNLLHHAEARLARWLLSADDRMDCQVLSLTQEFLGIMLGVRRTTVNLVASGLELDGLIHNSRGHITIRNRVGLEAVACPCYSTIRELNHDLYSTGVHFDSNDAEFVKTTIPCAEQ